MKIVLVAHTPVSWSGGVNSWCRSFMKAFPGTVHYSFFDIPESKTKAHTMDEPTRASVLARWLHFSKKIEPDDIIIGDGFWAMTYMSLGYKNVISVSHGLWQHITQEDKLKGIPPENPRLALIQQIFRINHQKNGGRNVAVSDFVAHEMKAQYDVDSHVINTGVDLERWQPIPYDEPGVYPLIKKQAIGDQFLFIHGINDPGNENKGWSHTEAVKKRYPDALVLSLDEARKKFGESGPVPGWPLNLANAIVIPSGFEGNSVFTLEALACDVPVAAYGVGLLWRAMREDADVGALAPRSERSPEMTVRLLDSIMYSSRHFQPRQWVSQFSIQEWECQWRDYLQKEFGYDPSASG